ncbi:hypothetical protein OAN44_00630 [Flavobacteriales bacterium]|nr:hypothetical protein [Flavobacteriales bacterium]
MNKNFKILLLSISILSFLLSCGSSKENPTNNKVFVKNDNPEIVIADSILESYRLQETSKKVGEVSFELLENPFNEKDNYIKVISSNQPSETWKKCDTSSFFCSKFYFTKYLINFHPVFADNNGNFLFFEGDEWIFYNQFPSKEIMEKIANDEITVPNEDKICYCYNSFDPVRYTYWISDEISYNEYAGESDYVNKLKLGKLEYQVYKSLFWDSSYNGDYLKFEKQTTKKKIFKILEENYDLMITNIKSEDSNKLNFALVPDSNKYGDNYNKGKILKSYLKANYPLKLDSSNEIKINNEKQDRFGYIKFDSIIAGPINYVFNSEESEMEFDSEIKIIFPMCNHISINNLLYCLGITVGDDEYGSCGEHKNKETYSGEWEKLTIKDTNNQTVLIYSYSAAGC